MKLAAYAFAGLACLGLGLGACTTVNENAAPAHSSSAPATGSPSPAAPSAPGTPRSAPSSQAPAPQSQSGAPNVTSPWAVVSAYYGDVESGNYQQAWALLNSGATTGQTYQQFVTGYACTGAQYLSKVSSAGNQVTFSLTAVDTCIGKVRHYTGTYTVQNGKIVAADVHQD